MRGQFALFSQPGGSGYWLPLPRGEGWGEGPARPVRTAGRTTVTGSLSHGERAGVRGQFGRFGRFPQQGRLVTGSLSHRERAGVRGQLGLFAQPSAPTVTGSLSHGERAGVRGQFALFPQPGALRLLAPSPTERGLG